MPWLLRLPRAKFDGYLCSLVSEALVGPRHEMQCEYKYPWIDENARWDEVAEIEMIKCLR